MLSKEYNNSPSLQSLATAGTTRSRGLQDSGKSPEEGEKPRRKLKKIALEEVAGYISEIYEDYGPRSLFYAENESRLSRLLGFSPSVRVCLSAKDFQVYGAQYRDTMEQWLPDLLDFLNREWVTRRRRVSFERGFLDYIRPLMEENAYRKTLSQCGDYLFATRQTIAPL